MYRFIIKYSQVAGTPITKHPSDSIFTRQLPESARKMACLKYFMISSPDQHMKDGSLPKQPESPHSESLIVLYLFILF